MTAEIAVPVVTKRAHLVTFLAALAVCLLTVLWMVGPYLLSLFLGGTLAMLAYPFYQWIRSKPWGRRTAAFTVTGLFVLLVIAPLTAFSVLAVQEGVAIGQELSGLKEFSPRALTVALSRWEIVRTVVGEPALVNARLKGAIVSAGQFTNAAVLKVGQGLPEFFLQIGLSLIAFYYFLKNGKQFMDWLLGLGALDENIQDNLVISFRETTISVMLAGLAAAAALAVLITCGFLVLGVPDAFLAGGLTFVFAWIPVIGTAPALLAGLLYLYVQGSGLKLVLMILLCVAATAVDHMVRPMVLKGRAGMHPLVGLVAIISGIAMFGILGVFIGPILAAMLLSLLRTWPVIGGRFGIEAA